ncbi:DNA gyrase subunit A [Candidatus Woesearchaeota archaeon]|nr:DNA gyrase subunit A [Candidatus Woesearchaeota archaeon]
MAKEEYEATDEPAPERSGEKIIPRVIEDEMKRSYLDYAMSVIVGRALPDVRDGLKPVHRRILYAMNDLGMKYGQPFKKCARIVGEVLGKYHPHGDSAVYDSLVRMAQDFSLRYPLINGQGNFGSVDGDRAAAMRYTEARLGKIADELLQDIDKGTVDFVENFDGSLKEPSVLPAKLPNLLINGSSGIAVGMATNIPPHNLIEVCKATIALIDEPELEAAQLMEHIQGPDFPTGGIIAGKAGIAQAYGAGRGRIRVKSVVDVEEVKNKKRLVVHEIPYMVNKAQLVEQIADCVREKRIDGVSDLRDESDRKGMRIVIELKRDANPEIVENQLFAHTRMQVTFGINIVALVNGKPKTLGLKPILEQYILHRRLVVRKRTEFELKKAEERAHILEGLTKALDHIDAVVALIKKAKDVNQARVGLIAGYSLSEIQANAILDMKLQKLAALEREKIRQELEELKVRIAELNAVLADEERILTIIKDELSTLMEKYGDSRRTSIIDVEDEELDLEDLIEPQDQVVTISNAGYAKRMQLQLYREQRRGGKGVRGATTKEDDFIEHLFIANTHDYLLIFTDKGKVYWKKVYFLPESSRQSKGKAIINLVNLEPGEKVNAVIPINEFSKTEFLMFATAKGTVKKTPLSEYSRPRQGGIKAINLVEGDTLVTVLKTTGLDQVMLASAKGQAVKFNEEDARPMGRVSTGVRGIRLKPNDRLVGAIMAAEEKSVLTVTANGFGKRSPISDYRLINRGGLGVRNILCSSRNGDVVAVKSVDGTEGIMLSTKNGIVIRTDTKDVRIIGRNTQGVKLMNLNAGDQVVAMAKIAEENGDDEIRTTAE